MIGQTDAQKNLVEQKGAHSHTRGDFIIDRQVCTSYQTCFVGRNQSDVNFCCGQNYEFDHFSWTMHSTFSDSKMDESGVAELLETPEYHNKDWKTVGESFQIFKTVLRTLELLEMFDQTTVIVYVLLLGQHDSHLGFPFLQYINDATYLQSVIIGVPYITSLWQAEDSTEQNDLYKTASVLLKIY